MDSEISEKSNNSSFEDLSNLNDNELKEQTADTKSEDVLDIIGNGQITKKVCHMRMEAYTHTGKRMRY